MNENLRPAHDEQEILDAVFQGRRTEKIQEFIGRFLEALSKPGSVEQQRDRVFRLIAWYINDFTPQELVNIAAFVAKELDEQPAQED